MGTVNVRYFATKDRRKLKRKAAAATTTTRVTAAAPRVLYQGVVPHPRASLLDGTGFRVDLPFAPTGGEWTGMARRWAEVVRPTRSSVLVDTGPGLRTVSYTLMVAYADGRSVADLLFGLQVMAAHSNDWQAAIAVLGLAGAENGPWRITELTVRVLKRQHGTNNPTMAEVDVTFTQVTRLTTGIARSGKKKKKKKKTKKK